MLEDFNSRTEAQTIFKPVLHIIPGLFRSCSSVQSALGCNLVGNCVAHERLGKSVNTDKAANTETGLELNGNLNETGLEVKRGVSDVFNIEVCSLNVIED